MQRLRAEIDSDPHGCIGFRHGENAAAQSASTEDGPHDRLLWRLARPAPEGLSFRKSHVNRKVLVRFTKGIACVATHKEDCRAPRSNLSSVQGNAEALWLKQSRFKTLRRFWRAVAQMPRFG